MPGSTLFPSGRYKPGLPLPWLELEHTPAAPFQPYHNSPGLASGFATSMIVNVRCRAITAHPSRFFCIAQWSQIATAPAR